MDLREVVEKYNQLKIPSLSTVCEKASQYSKTCLLTIIILFLVFIYLVQQIPHWQVAQFGIMNPKDLADAENSYRATLAQIFGGVAIAIGLYYTWRRITLAEEDLKVTQDNLKVAQDNLKVTQENLEATQKVAQENLKVAQEGQITERFTRAVDQLGAIDQLGRPAIEIRLGGIYALERIASESQKDYWPIMEILTAYIRKNSPVGDMEVRMYNKVSLDIQAVLTVIRRRNFYFPAGESNRLELQGTYLRKAYLYLAHLEGANFRDADLQGAYFEGAYFEGANLNGANLKRAYLGNADLMFVECDDTCLEEIDFGGACFESTNLKGANLKGANLKGTKNLTVGQLSKVKTLYNAKLDEELERSLREKYPTLFEKPKDEPL